MSYFSFQCEPHPEGKPPLTCAICDTEPLAAVSYDDGVRFYSEEGDELPNAVERASIPTKLVWHPSKLVLTIGWSNGTITSVDANDFTASDDTSIHTGAISLIKWSPDGERLVTGDEHGTAAIWKLDTRMRPALLQHYQKSGAITQCAFIGVTVLGDEHDQGMDATSAGMSARLTSMLIGGDTGIVFYTDDMGTCVDVLTNLTSPIDVMEYFPSSGRLTIITRNLLMTQLQVATDGTLSTLLRAKISVKSSKGIKQAASVGPGLLATISDEEGQVRIWDVFGEENYGIKLSSLGSHGVSKADKVNCIAFNPLKSILSVGTAEGKIVLWRYLGAANRQEQRSQSSSSPESTTSKAPNPSSEKDWSLIEVVTTEQKTPVHSLDWCPSKSILTGNTETSVSIWSEAEVRRAFYRKVKVMQSAIKEVVISVGDEENITLGTGKIVKGIDCSARHIIVWSGFGAEVYELDTPEPGMLNAKLVSTLDVKCSAFIIYADTIFAAIKSDNQVVAMDLQGNVKDRIQLSEMDGAPQCLAKNSKYMAISTSNGRIFVYDIDAEAPTRIHEGFFQDPKTGNSLGEMLSIQCSCDGQRVSMVAATRQDDSGANENEMGNNLVIASKIFVYDGDSDVVYSHKLSQSRLPIHHTWDQTEPKLLAVQTERLGDALASAEEEQKESGEDSPLEVLTFFCHADIEGGISLHDALSMDTQHTGLLGLYVPYVTMTLRPGDNAGFDNVPLRDFSGIEDCDEETKTAIINFSYELAKGNMDAAHRAVKTIDSPHVWHNMAFTCVKSKRLDVAEICLSNMGHLRGVRALHAVREREPEPEAAIAMVAVQLGLLADAARLYSSCHRWDLLNKLYQQSGEWEKALNIAKNRDRIHLSDTHFSYAKFLESMGRIGEAIEHYEASDTHFREVPRMLVNSGNVADLEQYVRGSGSNDLYTWWAQYLESQGNFDDAIEFYREASAIKDLVRIMCHQERLHDARELVLETDDKAAAYHLARHHEAQGNTRDALFFFEKSGRYNHAVRLAKDAGEDDQLVTLALQGTSPVMKEAARYFEDKGLAEKAVQLYHRSGSLGKALDLCFRFQLYEDLQSIADDLSAGEGKDEASSEVLQKCADFFLEHSQYSKAVNLLASAGQFEKALQLCSQHRVKITEELADAMTLPKTPPDGSPATEEYKERRNRLLLDIADVCEKQGSFHLATKKYTQAGDKNLAMRSLLKSGDTEKIVFFANVSRSKEIYVLAANYLQGLNWSEEPEIVKNIISFYSKARAYEQLSNFFDACSSVEIDEYRNYSKALKALKEALKYANKMKSENKDSRVADLESRIDTVDEYVKAVNAQSSDPDKMLQICERLLNKDELEEAVRAGDVYALMVAHHVQQGNMERAHETIKEMQQNSIPLEPFIESEYLQAVSEAVGEELRDEEDEDEIEEDIPEGT
eukprot:gb/GECG01001755.1/.p1 GENE.gb/GECG01001755.1/~~gb/GECG01001755.1/.p1  ORF type:complete len:1428 (+),score=214.78 gb/GECG01001755.1/:1-4284(+)